MDFQGNSYERGSSITTDRQHGFCASYNFLFPIGGLRKFSQNFYEKFKFLNSVQTFIGIGNFFFIEFVPNSSDAVLFLDQAIFF
jgi:hypothetical protein